MMNKTLFFYQDYFPVLHILNPILVYIIVNFTICGCKIDNNNSQRLGMTYQDFDFSTMRPIFPMGNDITYPLVKIEQNKTSLIIKFEYDEQNKRILNLSLVNDSLWVSNDSVVEDYLHYFKVFYKSGKIYSVEYSKKAGTLEIKALVIEIPNENKFSTYTLWKGIDIQKMLNTPWDIDLKKASKVEESERSVIQGGKVIKMRSVIVIDKMVESHIENYSEGCYEINGHPINFFNYFAQKYKKIDCPR